jgi:hypothetical protein
METREVLKLAFYNMEARLCLIRSSRHLTKSTLLNDKAVAYMEKRKAILNKHN